MKIFRWIDRQIKLKLNRPVKRVIDGYTGYFHVNSKDEYKVAVGALFEEGLRKEINALLKPDDILFEVGAHIGTWSVFLAQVIKEGELHVFEPVPINYQKLQANISLNKLTNVKTYPCAIGKQIGEATLSVPDTDAPAVGSLYSQGDAQCEIQVPLDTIDHLAQEHGRWPTFLKIDCEGAEADVLRGAQKALANSVRAIFIEVHPNILKSQGEDPDALIDGLLKQGFTIKRKWDGGFTDRFYVLVKPA